MHPIRILLFALSVCAPSISPAQEQAATIKGEIGVFVEHIELDEPTATKLVRAHDGDGSALRDRLQTLVEEKKATIIESSYLLVSSGTTGRIESVANYTYPTDYLPETVAKVSGDVGDGVVLALPACPVSFSAQKVGNVLEVRAEIVAEGAEIELNLNPQLVELTGETVFGKGLSETIHPTFYSHIAQSKLTVTSGDDALLAVQTPKDPKAKPREPTRNLAKRVFVMVRPTILKKPQPEK